MSITFLPTPGGRPLDGSVDHAIQDIVAGRSTDCIAGGALVRGPDHHDLQ